MKKLVVAVPVGIVAIVGTYFIFRHIAKKRGYSTTTFGATIFGVPKKNPEFTNK